MRVGVKRDDPTNVRLPIEKTIIPDTLLFWKREGIKYIQTG